MNNSTRFKLKMLIVLMFCVFMTFSMLIYLMKMTGKCEDSASYDTCLRGSKNPVFKATYVFYNTQNQLSKPSVFPGSRKIPGGTTLSGKKTRNIPKSGSSTMSIVNVSLSLWKQSPSSFDSSKNSRDLSTRLKSSTRKPESSSEVYEQRRRTLHQLCPKYLDLTRMHKIKKMKLNHILIDDQHKVLYCYVPKVACTNWKRIFLVLTGKAKNITEVMNLPANQVHAKNLFKTLQNYSVSEVVNMTEEYTKFIFVRHPFERLLSAYRNKLEQHYDSSKYFQARFGKYIIKNFRKNPSNVSLAKGDDVTFAEFVRYIVSSNPSRYNEHWQRVTDLCHPCLIRYDFIGKYDSLADDSNYLLEKFGAEFKFPLVSKPSTTSTNLKKYFATLERTAIYELYKIYEMDFRLFGYDLSDIFQESSSTVR